MRKSRAKRVRLKIRTVPTNPRAIERSLGEGPKIATNINARDQALSGGQGSPRNRARQPGCLNGSSCRRPKGAAASGALRWNRGGFGDAEPDIGVPAVTVFFVEEVDRRKGERADEKLQ
jgi:hypothetical protein